MGKMSILEVLRLRASPVSRDKFVRRFAPDDDFVASWTKNTQNKVALMGVVLDNFMRPCRTEAAKCEFSRRLFSPCGSYLHQHFCRTRPIRG